MLLKPSALYKHGGTNARSTRETYIPSRFSTFRLFQVTEVSKRRSPTQESHVLILVPSQVMALLWLIVLVPGKLSCQHCRSRKACGIFFLNRTLSITRVTLQVNSSNMYHLEENFVHHFKLSRSYRCIACLKHHIYHYSIYYRVYVDFGFAPHLVFGRN